MPKPESALSAQSLMNVYEYLIELNHDNAPSDKGKGPWKAGHLSDIRAEVLLRLNRGAKEILFFSIIAPDVPITAQELKVGQVVESDGSKYIVLVIGAAWSEVDEALMADANSAVIADVNDHSKYYNLELTEN